MKNLTIFSLLSFLLLIDFTAAKEAEIDIGTIEFDIYKSFDVINSKTGRQSKIRPDKSRKVKIVGKNKWAYEIKLTDSEGNIQGPTFLVAQKWARRALNIQAALHAARLKQVVDESTLPPQPDCKSCGIDQDSIPTPTPRESVVTTEDLIDPAEKNIPVVTDNRDWKPGCQVLAKGNELQETDSEELFKCVRSIQKSIAKGARNRNGTLNRSKAFKNLYKMLNKEEQRFAAHIFTAQGEAAILANTKPPRYEEMIAVMKVIDNRMNASNNNRRASRKPFNELDVTLDPWQFSMYNKNDPGWRRSLDIDHRTNFSTAIHSYISFVGADLAPRPEVDRVYHYHANYVNPNWKMNSKRITVNVDGKEVKGGSRTKHYFYRDIAWSKNPRTPWRG